MNASGKDDSENRLESIRHRLLTDVGNILLSAGAVRSRLLEFDDIPESELSSLRNATNNCFQKGMDYNKLLMGD